MGHHYQNFQLIGLVMQKICCISPRIVEFVHLTTKVFCQFVIVYSKSSRAINKELQTYNTKSIVLK